MGTIFVKNGMAIVTDGCGDVSSEEARERSICVLATQITLGDGTLTDSDHFTAKDFWDSLFENTEILPKTALVTPGRFLECYKQAAEAGATHILAIIMSSALSGGYDAACQAAEHAPVPTTVIDSRAVTRGTAIQVLAAADLRDAGLPFDEIVEQVTAVRDSMHIDFVVDNLEFLVRGGRAGKSAQMLASVLNIKPVLRVFEDGSIDAYKKCRGAKKSMAELAKRAVEDTPGKGWHYSLAITSKPELEAVANEALKKAGFEASYDGPFQVGIIVGIYCGPGTVAVLTYRLPTLT